MRKFLFLLSCSVVFASPALAQEIIIPPSAHILENREITVLATGQRLHVSQSGQSVSVMSADEIADVQGADVTRVLERLPGVTLARNGSLGGLTSLFVRGANSQQVLVLVDGVRLADAASPGGGYDFGNLMTGPIGKVELLRGSNSVVWGSEAIGGVVAFTSREVHGVEASAEYGARDTINADVTGGIRGDASVTVSAGYTETDGFSQAASGTEADGFRQYRVSGRGEIKLVQNLSVVFAGRYADSRLEIDGFPAPAFTLSDTAEFSEAEEISGRAGLAYDGDLLDIEASYSIYDVSRENFDPDVGPEPGFASDGRQERVEMRGRWGYNNRLRIDFGAAHEWSRFETNFDEPASANTTSAHALLGWYGKKLTVAAGARIDDHSRFGSDVTFGANGSVQLGEGWRVRASYGEGFKAPTLYQLFSDFGNEALAPERSRSFDIGIEKGARNDPLHLAVTAFRRDTRGLIDFVSCFSVSDPLCDDGRFGFYQNVGKARAEGFEVELAAQVSERLRAQAAYTYVKSRDLSPGGFNEGNTLARRPRHAVTVAVDWETPLAGLELGGDVRMVSGSFDDAGNFTRLDGYALGTLRALLPVSDEIALFGRIENVTDTDYETAAGYGTPGRSAYVGARARF